MPPTTDRPAVPPMSIKTLQVVFVAMAAGITIFAVIVLMLNKPPSQPGTAYLLAGVLALVAVSESIAFVAIRQVFLAPLRATWAQSPPADPAGSATGAYTTLSLIRGALVEAVGLLAPVFALVTGRPLFMIAAAAAVALLLISIPTGSRLQRFADSLLPPR